MRALDKKLIRDLIGMKGQAVAIGAVITCGIAIYIGWQTTFLSLDEGLKSYYDQQRFASVFASLKRAPSSLVPRVMEIPGVSSVESRIVEFVSLDIESLNEPAGGRILSIPDRGEPKLNGVHLLAGRFPEPGRPGEVIAEEGFVKAHGFVPGDSIKAVMNGKLQTLRIVGVGMSPEFITTAQPGSIFPDYLRFGIFWMRRGQMENVFDMEGAFNDLALSLQLDVPSESIILQLDQLLERYGGFGAHDRERHLSHRFISDELTQLKVMTLVPPSIFLGVAAFLLNVVLRRMLAMQRSQIAALKAFGYSSWEIGFHYGKLIGVIVVGGAISGSLIGTYMGQGLTNLYVVFYRFPGAVFQIDVVAYILAILLSLITGIVGVFFALYQAVKIQPAEAMRPEAPPIYRRTLFERLGWDRWLAPNTRMILRELMRRPLKAALTSVGIAFACAVIVVGNFGKDAIDFLIDFQFGLQQRQDVTVNFNDALPSRAYSGLRKIEGVVQSEPFRAVSVKLKFGQYSRQLSIMGLTDEPDLFRLLDKDGRVVDIPPIGLIVSSHLASTMNIDIGDEITIEVLEEERPVRIATVVSKINDYSGASAYMNISALNQLMREPPTVSGAFLTLDPLSADTAYRELKDIPSIAAVNLHRAAFEGFMESFAENLLKFRFINVIFACVIAVGVVYNSALVTLSERCRELATLRVIGFTRGEVSTILLAELAFLVSVAIPAGWLIGYGLCWAIVASLPTEHFRIPLVLSRETFGFAALIIAGAALISGLIVRRGIDRLSLVSVLKASG